jgi:hypothetical protein
VKKLSKTHAIYERLFTEQADKEGNELPAVEEERSKTWESLCKYRPLRGHTIRWLDGFVQEIGISGIRILIPEHVLLQVDHTPGGKFEIFLNFPDEDPLMVYGEISAGARGDAPGYRAFGIDFIHLTETTRK